MLLQRGSTQPQTSITPSLRQGHSSSLSKCRFPARSRNQSCCLCACRELLPEERGLPAIFTSQFASWALAQQPRTCNDQVIAVVLLITGYKKLEGVATGSLPKRRNLFGCAIVMHLVSKVSLALCLEPSAKLFCSCQNLVYS